MPTSAKETRLINANIDKGKKLAASKRENTALKKELKICKNNLAKHIKLFLKCKDSGVLPKSLNREVAKFI